jgi:hypothetical protein
MPCASLPFQKPVYKLVLLILAYANDAYGVLLT